MSLKPRRLTRGHEEQAAIGLERGVDDAGDELGSLESPILCARDCADNSWETLELGHSSPRQDDP